MAGGDGNAAAKNYEVKNKDVKVKLWKEVEMKHLKTYEGERLSGDTYQLKNISKSEMQLSEDEFLHFRPGILAVAIENLKLKSEELTKVYIVHRTPDGER